MATPIQLKRSAVPGKVPTTSDLNLGEVAINTYDGRMYLKKDVSGVQTIIDITAQPSWGELSGNIVNQTDLQSALSNISGEVTTLENNVVTGAVEGPLRADLAATTGSSLVGFLQSGAGTILRTIQNKAREWLTPYDFGAAGNAVTDDTTKVQAMFDAAAAITADPDYVQGALVTLPPGSFGISDTITLTSPPMVIGAGYAERTTNPNGAGRGITQFVALPGLAGKPMFRIKSNTLNEQVHGGKFLNVNLVGSSSASYGIWGSSMSHCDFDVRAFRFAVAGIRSDDGNGVLSDRNTFDLHYVAGANAGSWDSHGLWIIGENAGAAGTGNPQNIVKRLSGLIHHGDGLRLEGDVDNTIIQHTAMALSPTGTGRNVAYIATTAVPRVNFCHYSAGGRHFLDTGTYGNMFVTSSETTSFEGDGLYDLLTTDYATGGFWQTNRHLLSDELVFTPTDFQVSAGAAGASLTNLANYLPAWALDPSTQEGIATSRKAPVTWRNCSITHARVNISFDADPGAGTAVVLQVGIATSGSPTDPLIGAPANTTFTYNLPNNTIRRNFDVLIPLASPVVVPNGGMIVFRILRVAADAADTATTDMFVVGASLLMKSLGPQSVGSGVINVPPMGT